MMLLVDMSSRPRDDDRCVFMQALYMAWLFVQSFSCNLVDMQVCSSGARRLCVQILFPIIACHMQSLKHPTHQ